MISRDENKRIRIAKPAWIVGILLAIALLAAGFYLFNKYNAGYGTKPSGVGDELQSVRVMEGNAWQQERQQMLQWYGEAIGKVEERVNDMEQNAINLQNKSQREMELYLKILEDDLDTLRSEVRQMERANKDHWEAIKPKVQQTKARIEGKLKNDFRDYTVSAE